jgi:hypothetical protein
MTREEQDEIWFDALLKVSVSEALKNEMNTFPSNEELNGKYKPSSELNRRIKWIITKGRIKSGIQIYAGILRKVAVCIIIILAVSSLTLFSVEATRNAIFNTFIERFDKYTEIKFRDFSTDDKLSNIYRPAYLPEGFKEISTESYGNTVMITYSNTAGIEIRFKQRPAGTGTSLIDNENTDYKEVEINGNKAYLFEAMTKDDYSILLWQSEGIVFELTSQISIDELVRIGNSIKSALYD